MAGNGGPEQGGFNGVRGVAGGIAKGVLLVLLALAACLGYFYYFTDVLRPKEETPMQSEVYPAEVKKPLPERPSQPDAAKPDETAAVSTQAPSPSMQPETSAPSGQPVGKAPQVVANTPARQGEIPAAQVPGNQRKAAAAVAAEKTAAKTEPVKGAEKKVKPAEKQAAVAAKPKPKTEKPAAGAKKTASVKADAKVSGTAPPAGKKPGSEAAAKTAAVKQKTASAEKPAPKPVKAKADYSLIVGTYVMKSTLMAAKAKLEHAGFKPAITPGRKKSEPMNRLLLAEFASYTSASSELKKVRKSSKDAFILQQDGRYAIYAGSYFDQARASQEQERLRREGFAPIVKKSSAPVQTFTLSAGGFATREQAEKGAARLRKLGFKPIPAPVK